MSFDELLEKDREALALDERVKQEVWERLVRKHPELADADRDTLAETPWWRRFWRWIAAKVRP